MGALIILGAVLLLIVRYIIQRNQRGEEEDEDLAASIEKLKTELQQSADTIIKRLGSHVTKLEGLLREVDDRRVRLETRVADAQRLEWALRQRIEELERRLRDLGQNTAIQQQAAQRSLTSQKSLTESPAPVSEVRRTDGDEFAAVLHQSMLREQPPAQMEMPSSVSMYASSRPQAVPVGASSHAHLIHPTAPPQAMQQMTQDEAALAAAMRGISSQAEQSSHPAVSPPTTETAPAAPQEDETIIKARALLRAGRTIEQVARETGVEIGALRLMKQMTQKD